MLEPDYFANSQLTGGYLDDVPPPRVRMFPNSAGRKRRARVHLSTYVGYSMGATHYYAKITEEFNRIWFPREQHGPTWVQAWDDTDGRGRKFEGAFDTALRATIFADEIIAEHFSDYYEIIWDTMEIFHLYKREGD